MLLVSDRENGSAYGKTGKRIRRRNRIPTGCDSDLELMLISVTDVQFQLLPTLTKLLLPKWFDSFASVHHLTLIFVSFGIAHNWWALSEVSWDCYCFGLCLMGLLFDWFRVSHITLLSLVQVQDLCTNREVLCTISTSLPNQQTVRMTVKLCSSLVNCGKFAPRNLG